MANHRSSTNHSVIELDSSKQQQGDDGDEYRRKHKHGVREKINDSESVCVSCRHAARRSNTCPVLRTYVHTYRYSPLSHTLIHQLNSTFTIPPHFNTATHFPTPPFLPFATLRFNQRLTNQLIHKLNPRPNDNRLTSHQHTGFFSQNPQVMLDRVSPSSSIFNLQSPGLVICSFE